MKFVLSREGQVRFQVPNAWRQEDNDEGTMLYSKEKNSGTLRLDVLCYKTDVLITRPALHLSKIAEANNTSVEELKNGNWFVRSLKLSESETGEPLAITFWHLQRAEGVYYGIAIFSYTLLRDQMNIEKYASELEMLDASIRDAEFMLDGV